MTPRDRQTILLVGDFDSSVESHRRAPSALAEAFVAVNWTDAPRVVLLTSGRLDPQRAIADGVAGVWVLPGSPYDDNETVIGLVQAVVTAGIPLLATCAGLQYTLVALARRAGMADATHAELGGPGPAVVERLTAPMVGTYTVDLCAGGEFADIFGSSSAEVEFRCSFGPLLSNAALATVLADEGLTIEATFGDEVIAAVRSPGSPALIGTLFQPELSPGPDPVVMDFLSGVRQHLEGSTFPLTA